MIEKRRKLQSPFETNIESHEESIDDKKNKATSVISIVFSLLFAAVFLFYICKIDLQSAISSPSTYKLSTSTDTQPLSGLEAVHPDAERPTITTRRDYDQKKLRSFEKSDSSNELHQIVEPKTSIIAVPPVTIVPSINLESLTAEVTTQIDKLSKMKREQQIVMETSDLAKSEIAVLQKQLQTLIPLKYGPGPYQLEMTLRFPDSMVTDPATQSREETILIDLAPIAVVPYSVYYFLEVVDAWKGGVFHRNAGHVLQAQVRSQSPGLAFQEYSPLFPHKQFTLGYAGRPGGPAFYISTLDNVQNHGPASQGSKTEADGCFGKIANADGIRVVKRMLKQPGGAKGSGFIMDQANNIKIVALKLLR